MTKEEAKIYFKSLNYSGWLDLYLRYQNWLMPERVEQSCKFPELKNEIACFIIDCTKDDFNMGAYGSLEYVVQVVENTETEINITADEFRVTVDPSRNKSGIAHLARQIYRGNVGLHRGDKNRLCIRSDWDGTWFRRTNEDGEYIVLENGQYTVEKEIGINNHEQGSYPDSSLGCVILWGGGWMVKTSPYVKLFKPLLLSCSNPKNIPMVILSLENLDDILKTEKLVK